MKTIILAAGKGVRMQPLTLEIPKPLLKVLDKPLLEHIFDTLPSEISEIILVIGYRGEMIKNYFGKNYRDKKIVYIEQKDQSGTARALELCKPLILPGEKFLLMYADDLHSKESIEKAVKKDLSLLIYESKNPERFGVVEIDADNKIIGIEEKPEKPKTNLVAVGVYVLDDRIFKYRAQEQKGEFFLTDMIKGMIKDYPMYAIKTDFWHAIGYPKDLESAKEILSSKKILSEL